MASSGEYFTYILDQLSGVEGMTGRPMMGEYLIYCRGRLIGGIYDDRFLVKPTKSALKILAPGTFALPYEGAKEMLLVERVDDRGFLEALVEAMYEEVPEPKGKKRSL